MAGDEGDGCEDEDKAVVLKRSRRRGGSSCAMLQMFLLPFFAASNEVGFGSGPGFSRPPTNPQYSNAAPSLNCATATKGQLLIADRHTHRP